MEGFRFLQVGERVTYEPEVAEKGMKAVSSARLDPRAGRPGRDEEFGGEGGYDNRDDRDAGSYQQRAPRERESRPPRAEAPREAPAGNGGNDKASRKLERLISLLVEKGVLAPGEIDGLAQSAAGTPAANA